MSTSEETKSKSFPYKTLIWALLALVAMFLFKTEFKELLSKANEVSLFGIELKVGEEQAEELEQAIAKYKDEIMAFDSQMAEQQDHIRKLERLKQGLEKDLANCPRASEKALMLDEEFKIVLDGNKELQKQSDVIRNWKIWKRVDPDADKRNNE
ncbi:hypothetical protein POV27_09265 [Aureisphaera galaxeae]|uniref:hypothetical protein n=1 Tax=Aureisphaera galaxeae TaxID=1538023 RepID=UPI002350A4E6|nr:hypothetical protein [Aureisphaera galaxeae]MDC8004239.1 hypothetical protein [Aureisphaera galaxeae]